MREAGNNQQQHNGIAMWFSFSWNLFVNVSRSKRIVNIKLRLKSMRTQLKWNEQRVICLFFSSSHPHRAQHQHHPQLNQQAYWYCWFVDMTIGTCTMSNFYSRTLLSLPPSPISKIFSTVKSLALAIMNVCHIIMNSANDANCLSNPFRMFQSSSSRWCLLFEFARRAFRCVCACEEGHRHTNRNIKLDNNSMHTASAHSRNKSSRSNSKSI